MLKMVKKLFLFPPGLNRPVEFKGSPSVSGLGAVQVGNNLLILLSLIFSHLRLDANHYLQMDNSEAAEIFKQSGCSKPCVNKRYNFVGEKQTSSFFPPTTSSFHYGQSQTAPWWNLSN